MSNAVNNIIGFIWIILWITGVVLAKGFWSVTFTIITGGIYSTYLIIEKVLQIYGII